MSKIGQRVRALPGERRRRQHRPEPREAPCPEAPAPAASAAPAPVDADQERERTAPGPEDRALFSCRCGSVFQASVTASVRCPHCGESQAW